jgi:hypothetical protein
MEGRNGIFYTAPARVSVSSAYLPAIDGVFCMSVKRVDMNNSTPTITAFHPSMAHQNIPRVSSVKTVNS